MIAIIIYLFHNKRIYTSMSSLSVKKGSIFSVGSFSPFFTVRVRSCPRNISDKGVFSITVLLVTILCLPLTS